MIAGAPLSSASVTFAPLTVTEATSICAPSAAVTSNCSFAGAPAVVPSRSSPKTIVSEVPAAATLAETGAGATMSSLVACAAFDGGPVPWVLFAETR